MRPVIRRLGSVLVFVAVAGCGRPGLQQPETATVQLAAGAPSRAEQQSDEMFLSHRQVSSAGQLVALAMTPESNEAQYGVNADLERWDGSGWAFFAPVHTAPVWWARQGEVLVGIDPDTVGYEAVDLSAAPGQVGSLESVALPALEPGWYRFSRPDGSAPFEVVNTPLPVGPDLEGLGSATLLEVAPAVVATAAVVRLVPVNGTRLAQGDVLLAAWDGTRWTQAERLLPDVAPEPVVRNAHETALSLPELPPGSYRLTATDEAGAPRVGYVFVAEGPAAPPPAPLPSEGQATEPEGCGYASVRDYMAPGDLTPEDLADTPPTAREAIAQLRPDVEHEAAEAPEVEAATMGLRAGLYAQLAPRDGESPDHALVWTADDGQGSTLTVTLMAYGPGFVVEYEEATFPPSACPPEPHQTG